MCVICLSQAGVISGVVQGWIYVGHKTHHKLTFLPKFYTAGAKCFAEIVNPPALGDRPAYRQILDLLQIGECRSCSLRHAGQVTPASCSVNVRVHMKQEP